MGFVARRISSANFFLINNERHEARIFKARNSPKIRKNAAALLDAPRPFDQDSRVEGAPSSGERRVDRSGGDGRPVGVLVGAPHGERRRFPRRGLARGEQVPRKCHLIGPGALLGPGFVFLKLAAVLLANCDGVGR